MISDGLIASCMWILSETIVPDTFACHQQIPHPQKHGCRYQNIISICPMNQVMDKNVISPNASIFRDGTKLQMSTVAKRFGPI